jgi:hypothetical protein
MDPYLEPAWRDVHHKLCTYACDDIQSQLGDGMFARVDERLVVEFSGDRSRSINPDVRVYQKRPKDDPTFEPSNTGAGGIAVAEPITIEFQDEEATQGFIEIIDRRSGGKVITAIEFLSITNKTSGVGRETYQGKQLELRAAGVSTVEINLLRAGVPAVTFPIEWVEPRYRTQYNAVIRKAWVASKYFFYPMPLSDRLPMIGIPLRESDQPIPLDLQSLIDRVYQNGAYGHEIDYAQPLSPPLEKDEAEWVTNLLR